MSSKIKILLKKFFMIFIFKIR